MMKAEKSFNWRLLARNRRYLLYAVGVGLLGLLLIWQAMVPLITTILSINQEISKQEKLVNQLQQKAAKLKDLEVQDISASQKTVNAVLPSKKPVLELLAGLNVVAGRSGVTFTDFAVSPGVIATNSADLAAIPKPKTKVAKDNSTAYDTLSVQLTVEGPFAQVQAFIKDIEGIAPFTTVTDLDLSIRKRQGGTVQSDDFVSADMMLDTYFYTQSLKAALTSPLPVTTTQHDQVLSELQTFIFPTLEEQREVISQGVFDIFGVSSSQLLEELPR